MKIIFLSDALETLANLFFKRKTHNDYLAVKTLEFYVSELKMLEDSKAVAMIIEKQNAFALVPLFHLFDSVGAEKVELILAGKVVE